jgi:hypothetical protein
MPNSHDFGYDMQHSFTLSLAWGFVVAIAAVLVNVFPSQFPLETVRDRHGWPLIGVTRELTLRHLYPETRNLIPWPTSPVKHMEPAYLIVDGLMGISLVVASVFALHRILTREPFPVDVRISLWQILCGMTLFGVGLGVFPNLLMGFLLLQLPILIVYWSMVVIFLAIVDRRVRAS